MPNPMDAKNIIVKHETYEKLKDLREWGYSSFDEVILKLLKYEEVRKKKMKSTLEAKINKMVGKIEAWDGEDIKDLKKVFYPLWNFLNYSGENFKYYGINGFRLDEDKLFHIALGPLFDHKSNQHVKIWGVDKNGYCLIGNECNEIKHIDAIKTELKYPKKYPDFPEIDLETGYCILDNKIRHISDIQSLTEVNYSSG